MTDVCCFVAVGQVTWQDAHNLATVTIETGKWTARANNRQVQLVDKRLCKTLSNVLHLNMSNVHVLGSVNGAGDNDCVGSVESKVYIQCLAMMLTTVLAAEVLLAVFTAEMHGGDSAYGLLCHDR